jgi:predicted XRE-type DNA-binding protein
MPAADIATIQALRSDLALQISRCLQRRGLSQVSASKLLDVPQPTLSKIVNGRVADLSLELLIRIAVRAGLPVVMQTGDVPEEAGAYVFGKSTSPTPSLPKSRLAQEARDALIESARKLTPEQRLNAMLEQSQLVSQLHAAGRKTEVARSRKSRPPR